MKHLGFTSGQWATLGYLAVAFVLLGVFGVLVANPFFNVLGSVVWVATAVTAITFYRRNRRDKRSV